MTDTPKPIVDLYEQAQVDQDMDAGTYVGGTDQYGIPQVLEAIAKMVGWTLPPRMKLAQREQWLRDRGREAEIDLLGVNGD